MPRRLPRCKVVTWFSALLLLALSFTAARIYVAFHLSDKYSLEGEAGNSSAEFLKEFVWPSNEPIVELALEIAKKPKIPPLLSNMRSIDESKLPYKCGIIFFYHIACTGGASMNHWLGKQVKHNGPHTSYWTSWGRHDGRERKFIDGMNNQTKKIGPNEWRVVHAHGYSYFPNASEAYLYQWREEVESQGCAFVVTTMLRDAIGHTISQTKGMIKPNLTLDEFMSHLEPENYNQRGIFERGAFVTQLDYLLYNMGPRNEYNATKEEKVRRAVELLQRHFDVLLLSDYDRFTDIIHKITGWSPTTMKQANVFDGDLNYSYAELQKIKHLTEANGDTMFIDAVKHLYYGHLEHLVI
mmetsp:Transcript_16177/g.24478  ORF Transcript_16177/g.24478 Transcript_16177/m.24478 type:complete len:354 (-) Transcript_16177:679-1740(-)